MKPIHLLGLALLAAALGTRAGADEPRHAFECDTPAGHFSYWHRSLTAGEIEVSGKVTINEMLKDKKWNPTAFVSLRGGEPSTGPFGLRIYSFAKTPEYLILELLKVGGRDPIGLGMIPATKKPIPFTLSLDASGLLKVTVAGTDASTKLGDFKPRSLELSCSTGDFEFTDVAVVEK